MVPWPGVHPMCPLSGSTEVLPPQETSIRSIRGREREEIRLKRINRPDPRWQIYFVLFFSSSAVFAIVRFGIEIYALWCLLSTLHLHLHLQGARVWFGRRPQVLQV